MILIENLSIEPKFNLALEEYVFERFDRGEDYLILWQNAPTVVIGRHQNTSEEINEEYIEKNGIQVVRRLSGGGAVYHDLGNINYTFIVSKTEKEDFYTPLLRTCKSFGVEAELSGRNDVMVNGRKFSGNASYEKEGRIMHHASVMLSVDLDAMENALTVDKDKIISKGIKSVRSRVVNLCSLTDKEITAENFKSEFIKTIFGNEKVKYHILEDEECEEIQKLADERYGRWNWNFAASPPSVIEKSRYIQGCGRIKISMNIESGRIGAIRFGGDFLGDTDITQLEAELQGCILNRKNLAEAIDDTLVRRCIKNMTAAELIKILI